MGRCTFSIGGLIPPFESLEEWYLTIPAGQSLEVLNVGFKLLFILDGKVSLAVPGEPTIELAPSDAFSLSRSVVQTYQAQNPDRDTRLYVLLLRFRWGNSPGRSQTAAGEPSHQFEAALREKLTGFQYFHHSLFGDYYPISRQLLSELEHQNEASAWKISGLCQALTASLLSSPSATVPRGTLAPHRSRDLVIEHALQYLQENCHTPQTLDSIAWQVRLSGEYLARLFKQVTGRTVFQWLDYFRTEKARNMLMTTELPLSVIAHACGYSSANLFSRHFKQNTGYAPTSYRLKIQSGEKFSPQVLNVPLARKRALDPRVG